MNDKPIFIGFLEAAGLAFYISAFAIFVEWFQPWFVTHQGWGPALSIIIFLQVFVFSALVCSAIALVYPALLFFRGEWKRGLYVIVWTAAWLLAFIALVLAYVLIV